MGPEFSRSYGQIWILSGQFNWSPAQTKFRHNNQLAPDCKKVKCQTKSWSRFRWASWPSARDREAARYHWMNLRGNFCPFHTTSPQLPPLCSQKGFMCRWMIGQPNHLSQLRQGRRACLMWAERPNSSFRCHSFMSLPEPLNLALAAIWLSVVTRTAITSFLLLSMDRDAIVEKALHTAFKALSLIDEPWFIYSNCSK